MTTKTDKKTGAEGNYLQLIMCWARLSPYAVCFYTIAETYYFL